MRTGLVLGAGGVVGGAYHAGALTALEHDLGWDPRRADVIVGTSAGALVGALLRAGVPASDLAAWTVEAPLSSAAVLLAQLDGLPEMRPAVLRDFVRIPRLPTAEAVRATLRRPHRFRPLRAYLTGIDGDQELGPLVGFLGEGWPGDDLWICATRRVDGRRVVYGRPGAPPVPLSTAVAASSAVPGYFRAVAHGGDEYVDGGVISATNADVLRTRDLDLVVVVAPMSTRAMPRVGVAGAIRIFVRRQLTAELARLEAEGIETLVIEPGPRVLRHIGTDFMATDALTDIVRDAFFDTGRLLAGAGERAARLASRHAARGMQHRHAAEAIGPPDLPRRRCRVP